MTNIAIENDPFIDGLPIKYGWIFHGYVLNNQMVPIVRNSQRFNLASFLLLNKLLSLHALKDVNIHTTYHVSIPLELFFIQFDFFCWYLIFPYHISYTFNLIFPYACPPFSCCIFTDLLVPHVTHHIVSPLCRSFKPSTQTSPCPGRARKGLKYSWLKGWLILLHSTQTDHNWLTYINIHYM